ncbi:MAG: cation-transporting P-type ATPase [Nitrospirota bacterium]
MKINELTREDVFRTLVTSSQGLSGDEAGRRLAEFGPNAIQAVRKRPLPLRFLGQFTHFLAVLLWIAAALSFLSEYFQPGEGMLTLGLAIVGVVVINAVFTFIQEYRAEKALEALKKLLPFKVTVRRGGREQEMPAEDVVPGDIVLIAEGDKVPADLRLVEANELRANNASLTGESEPVPRDTKQVPGDPINSSNIVFAGTTVVNGNGTGVVYATGMRTEFGRIAQLTGTVTPGLSPLQKEIVKATRLVAAIAGVVGIFFFALGFVIGRSFWDNFIFAVGITVALIPEGMLPTVTLALAMGSQRMAKRNALIKTLTSVETLGSVSVICTDKTGTLTQNRMEVKEAAGLGMLSDALRDKIFTVALHCNNTKENGGTLKGEPTEIALYSKARETLHGGAAERVREFPFDSERKRMSTLTRIDGRTLVLTKGAPESVLSVCTSCYRDGEKTAFDDDLKREASDLFHRLMDKGLRVLAFAEREVPAGEDVPDVGAAERDMVFSGFIGLEDPPRPEVPEALRRCREAGIRIIMITGDASRTAVAIAREIGLVSGEPVVVEGADFAKLSDADLRNVLAKPEVLFTRMTPKYKLRVVSALKDQGERVAVTGDGVNDAPALKRADIGIAMGITGTDVAKESADMILLDDNFATIINAVEEGRTVYENIRKFITYIFASNIPEAVPFLAYILFRIPLPLTIMQILAVDLGTDMLPALALGSEKPTPGVMKLPPRDPSERLIGLPLISRAYLFLGSIEAAACMFGFFWVLTSGGWSWGQVLALTDPLYLQATTACLTAIIVCQVANVFACRSHRESIFTIGWASNKLIFLGIGAELLLQFFIVYHPFGNALFATAPLPLSTWLMLIPFALFLLLAEEVRKLIVRRASPA